MPQEINVEGKTILVTGSTDGEAGWWLFGWPIGAKARNNRSKWHAHVDRGCYIIYKRMQRPAYRSDRPVRFQHLSLFFPFTVEAIDGEMKSAPMFDCS